MSAPDSAFITRLTLETCVSRVAQLQDLRPADGWSPTLHIHLQADTPDTYALRVDERWPAPLRLKGKLTRLPNHITEVTLSVRLQRWRLLAEIALVAAFVALVTWRLGLFTGGVLAVLAALFFRWVWRGIGHERARLLALLQDTLQAHAGQLHQTQG
ncbi:MAG: hypothetical protein ACOYL5_08330 [Phototrophicaceae bacterium]